MHAVSLHVGLGGRVREPALRLRTRRPRLREAVGIFTYTLPFSHGGRNPLPLEYYNVLKQYYTIYDEELCQE